jgi:ferredoxin
MGVLVLFSSTRLDRQSRRLGIYTKTKVFEGSILHSSAKGGFRFHMECGQRCVCGCV